MPLNINGVTYRNLEEQVRWNQEQINLIKTAEITLADFGIKVIDTFANVAALYAKYPEDEFTGDFGDACAVGSEAPYTYYVWTRTTIEGNKGYWFDVGVFPAPGTTGATGAQGPQGPQGDVGGFIQIMGHLESTSLLPDPDTLTNRTWAYLVGNDNELYVQVPTIPGGSTYVWQNFGELNVATYCTVGGSFVNIFNLDTKLDKVTSATTYSRAYVKTEDGSQAQYNISTNNITSSLMFRDANGRSKIAAPSDNLDIANKQYVDSNLPSIIRG